MSSGPQFSSDTVSFSVVDSWGNGCSFVNSNYCGFGTGIVPAGCGFSLQNRGANFSTRKGHINAAGPRKRPYHTIIPGIALKGGNLKFVFNVMGGFMQPQGHVQVLSNMIDLQFNPQQALDFPRFCITFQHQDSSPSVVAIEETMNPDLIPALIEKGHNIRIVSGWKRTLFGRGQIIAVEVDSQGNPILVCGSDSRADGMALAQ